jgi:hypothetical protein
MENRRHFVRHRTLKGGHLVYDEAAQSADCLIRDLSDQGARIEVADNRWVPSEVVLYFDDGRPSHRCFVRWRRGSVLGIQFTDAKPREPKATQVR